jgi:hypothetical protein
MKRLLLIALLLARTASAQAPKVDITFTPRNETFAKAAEEYRSLWASEGSRMLEAMERVSGLKFPETDIRAEIYEAPSSSGFGSTPMNLRASYSTDVKKATLIHELCHRMNGQLRKRPNDIDEHRILFLYLYDVWEALYGKRFADEQVKVEQARKGLYDYESAWNWALKMDKNERASKLAEIVKANR